MKNFFLVLICIAFTELTYSQNWLWSHQAGGTNWDFESSTCIDGNDNTYLTGYYQSNPSYVGNETLNLNGFNDFFIAKYNSEGSIKWVKRFGGNNDSIIGYEAIACITFKSNFIYITGSFADTCIFGNDTLISTGKEDAFVTKLDTNGNVIWAKHAGGIDYASGRAMDVDANGNVYVEVYMTSSGLIDTINVSSGVFFTKWNSNGNCLWAKQIFTSISNCAFFQIQIKNNEIFAIGCTHIKTFTIDTITVTANYSGGQYLIARFDSNGFVKWVKPCAALVSYGQWGLAMDDSSNMYITGSFNQTGYFGHDTIYANVNADLFIAKYNKYGNIVWVRQAKASDVTMPGHGLTLSNNDIYITGKVIGNAVFGNDTISSVSPDGDMFVARYDSNGSFIGLAQVVNAFGGGSINVDNSGSVFVTGGFENIVTFGSNPSLSSHGEGDIFIAKSGPITGINNKILTQDNKLLIYANPTTGICNVTLPDEFQNEKQLTLKIYNNNGRLMQTVPVAMYDGKIQVNLQEEAKGIYLITLSNGAKSYSGKIIFE